MIVRRLILAMSIALATAVSASASDSLLDSLDYYISQKATFDKAKSKRIATELRKAQSASSPAKKLEAYSRLGEEFTL